MRFTGGDVELVIEYTSLEFRHDFWAQHRKEA